MNTRRKVISLLLMYLCFQTLYIMLNSCLSDISMAIGEAETYAMNHNLLKTVFFGSVLSMIIVLVPFRFIWETEKISFDLKAEWMEAEGKKYDILLGMSVIIGTSIFLHLFTLIGNISLLSFCRTLFDPYFLDILLGVIGISIIARYIQNIYISIVFANAFSFLQIINLLLVSKYTNYWFVYSDTNAMFICLTLMVLYVAMMLVLKKMTWKHFFIILFLFAILFVALGFSPLISRVISNKVCMQGYNKYEAMLLDTDALKLEKYDLYRVPFTVFYVAKGKTGLWFGLGLLAVFFFSGFVYVKELMSQSYLQGGIILGLLIFYLLNWMYVIGQEVGIFPLFYTNAFSLYFMFAFLSISLNLGFDLEKDAV